MNDWIPRYHVNGDRECAGGFDGQLQTECDQQAVVVIKFIERFKGNQRDTSFPKTFFQKIEPAVFKRRKIDMDACSFFESGSYSHDDPHKFVTSVVAFTKILFDPYPPIPSAKRSRGTPIDARGRKCPPILRTPSPSGVIEKSAGWQ